MMWLIYQASGLFAHWPFCHHGSHSPNDWLIEEKIVPFLLGVPVYSWAKGCMQYMYLWTATGDVQRIAAATSTANATASPGTDATSAGCRAICWVCLGTTFTTSPAQQMQMMSPQPLQMLSKVEAAAQPGTSAGDVVMLTLFSDDLSAVMSANPQWQILNVHSQLTEQDYSFLYILHYFIVWLQTATIKFYIRPNYPPA